MTDRELYNHIKATYKPEKGTALFFDLRNYHLCGLHPRVIRSGDELEANCFDGAKENLMATLDYFDDEIVFYFSYTTIQQHENLTKDKVLYYKKRRKPDIEKLKIEFAELILFLNNSEAF